MGCILPICYLVLHSGNLLKKFSYCGGKRWRAMLSTAGFYVKGSENWHFMLKNDMLFV